MANLGTLKVPLVLQASKFVTGMRSAQIAINQLEGKTKSLHRNLSNIGNALTMNVTVPLTIMGGAAVKAFSDFDLELRKISKTVEASDEFIRDLGGSFIDLSQDIGVSRNALSETAVAAGQLGVAAKDLDAFTRVATDMAAVSTLTGEEALTGLQRITKLTGTAERDFRKVADTIVEVGINLVTNEERIIDAATRLAATGRTVGLTAKQVIALSGAVTSVRDRVESGVTALDRVLSTMISATKEGGERLELFAHVANMTGKQFKKTFEDDAMSAIKQFIKGAKDFEERGGDIGAVLKGLKISGVRTVQTVRSLASGYEILEDAIGLANKGWEENSALTGRAEKVYGSVTHQMKALWETIKNTTALLGEAFQDSIKNMVTILKGFLIVIQNLVKQFSKLPSFLKNTIATFLTLVAVAGPLIAAAGLIGKAFAFIKVTLAAVSLSMGGVLGIIVAITVAVAGLTLALNRNKSAFDEEKQSMNGLFDELKKANKGSDKRKQLIKDINSIHGEYLDGLLTEESTWWEIYRAQKAANEELENRKELEEQRSKVASLYNRILNNQEEGAEAVKEKEKIQQQLNKITSEYNKITGKSLTSEQLRSRIMGETVTEYNRLFRPITKPNALKELEEAFIEVHSTLRGINVQIGKAGGGINVLSERFAKNALELAEMGKFGEKALRDMVKIPIKPDFELDEDFLNVTDKEIKDFIQHKYQKPLKLDINLEPIFRMEKQVFDKAVDQFGEGLGLRERLRERAERIKQIKDLREQYNLPTITRKDALQKLKEMRDLELDINGVLEGRVVLTKEQQRIVNDMVRSSMENLPKAPLTEFQENFLNVAKNLESAFASTIRQMVSSSETGFEAIAQAFKNLMLQMVSQMAARAGLLAILGLATGGGSVGFKAAAGMLGGEGTSIIDYIFGGGRANGGSVDAGTSYMVGEEGQEIFTPNVSGSITSNNDIIGTLEKGFGGIIESFSRGIPISGGVMKFNKDGLVEVVQDGTRERNARRTKVWGT